MPRLRSKLRADLTEAQEDYLKQILLLGEEDGSEVTTQALADALAVRPASVTGMVRRLMALDLVQHERYQGVRLTTAGKKVALEILRHHRLLETFLARSLGYGWSSVHAEAERLEHVISEEFEERIAKMLGHPSHDPHGHPIPTAELTMPTMPDCVALDDMKVGGSGSLRWVSTQDPAALNLLSLIGLTPGAELYVIEHDQNTSRIKVGDDEHPIPIEVACKLWIEEK